MSPVAPFLLRSDDNPEGIPVSVFDGFVQAAKADTPAWMKTFLDIFFSTGSERDASVSDEAFQGNWNLATVASARSAYIMRHAARKDWQHRTPGHQERTVLAHAAQLGCCVIVPLTNSPRSKSRP